jgi:hypothetical protein
MYILNMRQSTRIAYLIDSYVISSKWFVLFASISSILINDKFEKYIYCNALHIFTLVYFKSLFNSI